MTLPGIEQGGTIAPVALPGIEHHPHARAVLAPVLAPGGRPSHAYLFHGPSGVGKRTVARAFAAELLAEGAAHPEDARGRALRGAHPDLTWVTPSGAGEMLVGDVEEAVVAAAARTPFESKRRVWVLEDAHTLNEQAANRLLKTLEEPAEYAHFVLLAPTVRELLETIASRCQQVRFDPLPGAQIEARLHAARGATGAGAAALAADAASTAVPGPADAARLAGCARLGMGDARLAERLAQPDGGRLRERAEEYVRGALRGETAARPWLELLGVARQAGAEAGGELAARAAAEAELLPAKERKRHERDAQEACRRAERRARAGALDLALRIAQLWLRDLWCTAEGAGELVYALDRRGALEQDLAGRPPAHLREGMELVRDTRLRLAHNVSEELALEALAHRLQALLARG